MKKTNSSTSIQLQNLDQQKLTRKDSLNAVTLSTNKFPSEPSAVHIPTPVIIPLPKLSRSLLSKPPGGQLGLVNGLGCRSKTLKLALQFSPY
jgi:hypothetical protein